MVDGGIEQPTALLALPSYHTKTGSQLVTGKSEEAMVGESLTQRRRVAKDILVRAWRL